MAKLFAVCPMVGGSPDIDSTATPYKGYSLAAHTANYAWGCYIFSGTGAQLTALNALPQVVGIVAVTENGDTKWAERLRLRSGLA
jgi:hypothetical protein